MERTTTPAVRAVGPLAPRVLGRTGLLVGPVCVGTGALGGVPADGPHVDEADAVAVIRQALTGRLTRPSRIEETERLVRTPVPADLWAAVERLTADQAVAGPS